MVTGAFKDSPVLPALPFALPAIVIPFGFQVAQDGIVNA